MTTATCIRLQLPASANMPHTLHVVSELVLDWCEPAKGNRRCRGVSVWNCLGVAVDLQRKSREQSSAISASRVSA